MGITITKFLTWTASFIRQINKCSSTPTCGQCNCHGKKKNTLVFDFAVRFVSLNFYLMATKIVQTCAK